MPANILIKGVVMDEASRKLIIKINFGGLLKMGLSPEQALEIALDQEEPLFSRRLKLGKGGTSVDGRGAAGNTTAPGGTYGGESR